MRILNNNYMMHMTSKSREPCFTIRIDFDNDFSDPVFILSHPFSKSPVNADVLSNSIISGSSLSQGLKSISGIGGINLEFQDNDSELSNKIKEKLDDGNGIRLKRIRAYSGFRDLDWGDYEIDSTSLIGNLSYKDKAYKVTSKDIQRIEKNKKLFPEVSSSLFATLAVDEYSAIRVFDNSVYSLIAQGAGYTESPNKKVFYAEVDEEVIRCDGVGTDGTSDFLTIDYINASDTGRGLFKTIAAEHKYDSSVEVNRQLKVSQYTYIEMPVVKLIYAIMLKALYGQVGEALPDEWSLGIDPEYITTSDFTNIGADIWDTADDTVGVRCRFLGLRDENAKSFIEKSLLPMVGCFMPVYSDGSFGLKRRTPILIDSTPTGEITYDNIISHGDLTYDTNIVNKFKVNWNWSELTEKYQLTTSLVYADSAGPHTITDFEVVDMRGVYSNNYTDETLANLIDLWASRRVFPQWKLPIKLMPSAGMFEVGDSPYVEIPSLADFTSNNPALSPSNQLARVMEITRTSRDFLTGDLDVNVQASTSKIAPYSTFTSSFVLPNSFYDGSTKGWTRLSDEIGGALVGNVITSNTTITGGTNTIKWIYHEGDLTINSNVTVTIVGNVRWAIRGTRTNNGTINGVGGGLTGDIGTTGVGVGETGLDAWGYTLAGGGFEYVDLVSTARAVFSGTIGARKWGKESTTSINITYDGTNLIGLPVETRGVQGAAGGGITLGRIFGGGDGQAIGGNGGNGGAGFIEVARGYADGLGSSINLSGGDGSAGALYDLAFSAGGGAGGAPGLLIQLVDGPSISLPDDSRKTLRYGNYVNTTIGELRSETYNGRVGGIPTFISRADGFEQPFGYLEFSARNIIGNKNVIDSNSIVSYIKDNSPKTEVPNLYAPKAPIAFSSITSGTAELIKQRDGTLISRILVKWIASTDPLIANYEIRYKKVSDSQFIKIADEPKRSETNAYISGVEDGVNYNIFVAAKNIYGFNSSSISTNHVVVGKDEDPNDPISPTIVGIEGAIEVTWTNPVDKDLKTVSIFVDTSTPTDPADLYDSVPAGLPGSTQKYIINGDQGDVLFVRLKNTDTTENTGALINTSPASATVLGYSTGGGIADSIVGQGDLATRDDVDWDAGEIVNIPDETIFNIDDSTAMEMNPSLSSWVVLGGTISRPAKFNVVSNGGSTLFEENVIKLTGTSSVKFNTYNYNVPTGRVGIAVNKQDYFASSPLPLGSFVICSFTYRLEAITGAGRPGMEIRLYTGPIVYTTTAVEIDDLTLNVWKRQTFVARVPAGMQIVGIRPYLSGSSPLFPNGDSDCIVYFDSMHVNIMRAETISFDDGTRIEDLKPLTTNADNTQNQVDVIGVDGYENSNLYYSTFFDSIDALFGNQVGSGSGAYIDSLGGLTVRCGAIDGHYAYILRRIGANVVSAIDFTKNSKLKMSTTSNGITGAGRNFFIGLFDEAGVAPYRGYGFACNNTNTWHGFTVDRASVSFVSLNVQISKTFPDDSSIGTLIEAVFTAGSKVEFYIGGILRGELTTNLPINYIGSLPDRPNENTVFAVINKNDVGTNPGSQLRLETHEYKFQQDA